MRTPRIKKKDKVYVIVHPQKGVLIGLNPITKEPAWSNVWSPPTDVLPGFPSFRLAKRAARAFLGNVSLLTKIVSVRRLESEGKYLTTIGHCMSAGITGWLPGIPSAEASDAVWDNFLAKNLPKWCNKCGQYHEGGCYDP